MIKKFVSFVLMVGIVAVNFGFLGLITPRVVSAVGTVTAFSDTLSNSTASTVSNHTIIFTTPTGVASGATIILTFNNTTNTGSVVFGDIDLQDNGADVTLAAAPTGATWGAVNTSSTVITFTNGTTVVPAGHTVTIKIGTNTSVGGVGTHQITNGPAGSTVLRLSGTFNDIGSLAMPIIANSIVAVTAEVLASLTFTISSNALYFGQLNSAGSCFAKNTDPGFVTCPQTTEAEAFNMTAATNGTSGYTISVLGDTLRSGLTNTITANATNLTSSPGSEQFGLRINASGGTGAVSAPYTAAGYAYTGTTSTPATVATVGTPSLTTTYSVRYIANISTATEAGSYTTAHTYVATGNF